MKNGKIAYIGGGSRGWAWKLMSDLASEPALGGQVALYDIDQQSAADNAVIGNAITSSPEASGKWEYVCAPTLKDALTGADFAVISILPGTLEDMRSDVHLPERHGIYQSVGDTAGPGGLVRALRTIPMMAEIARAVRDFCPNAWVINYTNPMSLCIRALYAAFPDIKAFGCCHEVFGTQALLADIFQRVTGAENVARQEINVNVLGINHFTWFDTASCRGQDLFPLYRDFAQTHYERGYGSDWDASYFHSANRVKFDLFLRCGLIAAAGDRHLAEFMPGGMYLKDPATVRSWKFSLTPVDWRVSDYQARRETAARLLSGAEKPNLSPSGEEGVMLIKALCGFGRLYSNVNIPNTAGQIENLPRDAVVETNVVLEKDRLRPAAAGRLPESVLSLTMPHVKNQQLTLDAAMNCDFGMALAAFRADPLVKSRVTDAQAEALLRDMLRNTLGVLPEQWSASARA